MKDNIIIYEDGMTVKVWTRPDQGKAFAGVLTDFYGYCGGKIPVELFWKSIEHMSTVDATALFNSLVNDVVLKGAYMACEGIELYPPVEGWSA